jgi:hypothetical protein
MAGMHFNAPGTMKPDGIRWRPNLDLTTELYIQTDAWLEAEKSPNDAGFVRCITVHAMTNDESPRPVIIGRIVHHVADVIHTDLKHGIISINATFDWNKFSVSRPVNCVIDVFCNNSKWTPVHHPDTQCGHFGQFNSIICV